MTDLESCLALIAEARQKHDCDPRELGLTTAGKLLADLEWACEQVEETQRENDHLAFLVNKTSLRQEKSDEEHAVELDRLGGAALAYLERAESAEAKVAELEKEIKRLKADCSEALWTKARRIEELEDFIATAAEDDTDPEQGICELARLRRVEQMARDFIEYWIACRIREGEGPYFEDLASLDAAAAELRATLGETETP